MARASAKAWTDDVAPDRVNRLPSSASTKGRHASPATATRDTGGRSVRAPRAACSSTVTASHGSSAVFSTGSQAQ